MEGYYVSRFVLFLVCLVCAFAIYGSQRIRFCINKKVYNRFFAVMFLLLTAYIVYDNVCCGLPEMWLLAILGYLFVYFWVLAVWDMYLPCTKLEADKVYKMTVIGSTCIESGVNYVGNIETADGKTVQVYLNDEQAGCFEVDVKFSEIYFGKIQVCRAK